MEKPVLFSGPMVRAILSGTKTQTRRVLKGTPIFGCMRDGMTERWAMDDSGCHQRFVTVPGMPEQAAEMYKCPHSVGSTMWVKETWRRIMNGYGADVAVEYRATPRDWTEESDWHPEDKWRPSIFMPRWASRINLLVTNVRVERVQDISEADAMAEGVCPQNPCSENMTPLDAREEFEVLWDSINGKKPGRSWADNPWVFVYEFEVVR